MALFGNRNTLREAREERTCGNNIAALEAELKQFKQENKKLRAEIKELKRQLKIWNDPTYPRSGMW